MRRTVLLVLGMNGDEVDNVKRIAAATGFKIYTGAEMAQTVLLLEPGAPDDYVKLGVASGMGCPCVVVGPKAYGFVIQSFLTAGWALSWLRSQRA